MESSAPPLSPAHPSGAAGITDSYGGSSATDSSIVFSSLHAVKKNPAKAWRKTAAASPAALPKVYRVDPRGFRLLVQSLTGATELPPRRLLRDAAPEQLDLQLPRQMGVPTPPPPTQPLPPSSSLVDRHRASPPGEVTSEDRTSAGRGYRAEDLTVGTPTPSLYSACLSWCNLPLLSPVLPTERSDHSAVPWQLN